MIESVAMPKFKHEPMSQIYSRQLLKDHTDISTDTNIDITEIISEDLINDSKDDLTDDLNYVSPQDEEEINTGIVFQILMNNIDDTDIFHSDRVQTIRIRKIETYIKELDDVFSIMFLNRSTLLKELYFLHQTARALDYLNMKILNLSARKFRAKIYFPNLVYLLVKRLTTAKKFLQSTIRTVYGEVSNRSRGLINVHENSFYLDQDVIKTDLLYEFLGNGLKKFNPMEIGNLIAFYKSCFRSIIGFYLRKRRDLGKQEENFIDFIYNLELNNTAVSNRSYIYREVLFNIQIKKTYERLPILKQLGYNYQIFKSVIITNEFQNLYQISKDRLPPSNHEINLVEFYDDSIFINNPDLFEELKKLPVIYKLLRCVHIHSQDTRPYNEVLIKPEVVKQVIIEELLVPFRNMFIGDSMMIIIDQIANNFNRNILTGQYINLITFNTVKINNMSFLKQLRRFIQLCLKF